MLDVCEKSLWMSRTKHEVDSNSASVEAEVVVLETTLAARAGGSRMCLVILNVIFVAQYTP